MTHTQPAPAVRRLFEELVELNGPARRALLERARIEDSALASEVEALLAAADAAPEFLERPAEESELVGHRAGAWHIEERLGGGGAGDVYRARRADGGAAWFVALKVLRHPVAGLEARRRFEAERRSLAALNHPYIVPLVDAGTLADGRPYLATRLIEGEPLDRAVTGMALAGRLRLFLAVADAVQHAHQRLIAHCDLKPANILVTREGIPQLVDFGIARALGARTREAALTPGYASPEQLAGAPLGAASDVWSLGVVLFELATGKRPFARGSEGAALLASEALAAQEQPLAGCTPPDAPARLARKLRGDFDALAARALARDPAQRYSSVDALARDVEGYLAGRPIAARPAARVRQAWMWMGRHRAASAAGVLAIAALAVGAWTLRRDALQSRAEASIGWRAHSQAVLAMRWIEDLARVAGPTPELARALDEARANLAREADFPPEGEGRLRITLGALYLELDRPADALPELERARELATSTRGFGRQDLQRIEELLAQARGLISDQAPSR